MKLKNNKGAITVFISIVLSAVFLVIGTFSDAARISLAQAHVQRANKIALSSILACYNNQLKDEYGLFGTYIDNDTMMDSYEEYLSKNLNINENQNFLYDFNVEQINIDQLFNLEDREVFERQIMEFMKYRAPYEIASDLITKVNGMKNISSGSKVYTRKLETNKQANVIGDLQMTLEKKTREINESNISTKLAELKEDFINQNQSYDLCSQRISDLYSQLSKESDEEKKEGITKDISDAQKELINISTTKSNIKLDIVSKVNNYKILNSDAIQNAANITIKKEDLLTRIKEEYKYTEDSQDGIQELKKSYYDDLNNMKMLIGEDNSNDIISGLENNIKKCETIAAKANEDEGSFLSEIDKLSATNINYTFNKTSPAQSDDEDNRDKAQDELEKIFNNQSDSKTINSSLLKLLPSRKTNIQEEVDSKDWDNIDFTEEDYVNNNLEALSSKESIFGEIASKVTEELYINEYIMGTFKHDVPLLKGEEASEAYNLRSKDKTKRDAFFSDFEVEYIINGNKSEATNSLITKSEILAIRLISNVIHIYTDPTKMTRITTLAASLSAWSAGLATPLIQTLLVFAWAMVESVYDINQLTKGEKIPLFKTKIQWKTDISGSVAKNADISKDNSPLSLSYQDYLKIFLLLMDNDKKLSRIQDLVQLNLGVSSPGFLIEDCMVTLNGKTTVSMKNMFISFSAFTAKSRSNITRTYISEDMCIGY